MSLYLAKGGPEIDISSAESRSLLVEALDKLGTCRRVLAVPPDISRRESRAGELTRYVYDYYGDRLEAVLPAVGTHAAMSSAQLRSIFGDVPLERFRVHNWRADTERLGEVRTPSGSLALRGRFIGDDIECFHRAAELSKAVTIEMLARPIRKAVVYLDPCEYAYVDLKTMQSHYNPSALRHGYNVVDGEEIIFIANSGLGLWAYRGRF